jgi:hypothetical protein
VLFCVMCVICVLCLSVVPLPSGINPFAVKIINNNNNNNNNNNKLLGPSFCFHISTFPQEKHLILKRPSNFRPWR